MPQQCSLTLSLLGQRRSSALWDTLRTGLPVNFDNDISAISAREYPWLQLVADFSTADQLSTPRLHAWQVLHDPASDLAVSPAFLSLSADSVLAGQPVVLKLDIFNIGLARADSVRITFSESAPGSDEKLFSRVTLPGSLAADQKLTIDQLYTPAGKPGSRLLTIRVDGDNRINELSESNNTVTTRVQVVADTLQPQIEITFDGRTITPGDWVAAQPLIRARLIDDSPLSVADTLQINLLIDGLRVPFSGENGVQLLAPPDTLAIALLQHRPLLRAGEHSLEILFTDASGNINNTRIDFSVAAGLELQRVMNYPNPLSDHTDFTFLLTRPAEVRLRIYTVNGRLIRLLEAGSLGAGFNRLFWDGRDGDGDLIANGVYLYRVEARSGSEHAEVVEKCIIMR
ncbi:MAG: Basal-body rod modification protein FlgD [bacterium ADurb.Bin431]|nr:MAG: Basal-body rod modification protein FlgD [bacterium ADurb.Bin431]